MIQIKHSLRVVPLTFFLVIFSLLLVFGSTVASQELERAAQRVIDCQRSLEVLALNDAPDASEIIQIEIDRFERCAERSKSVLEGKKKSKKTKKKKKKKKKDKVKNQSKKKDKKKKKKKKKDKNNCATPTAGLIVINFSDETVAVAVNGATLGQVSSGQQQRISKALSAGSSVVTLSGVVSGGEFTKVVDLQESELAGCSKLVPIQFTGF